MSSKSITTTSSTCTTKWQNTNTTRNIIKSPTILDTEPPSMSPSSSSSYSKTTKSKRIPLSSMDMYSYQPSCEYTSYISHFGAICSFITYSVLALYICVTINYFISEPPELIKQGTFNLPEESMKESTFNPPPVGVEISYWIQDKVSGEWSKNKIDETNSDPFLRYKFVAKTIQNQDSQDRIETEVSGEACSFGGSSAVCANNLQRNMHHIEGMYRLPIYKYFEVEILTCTEGIHEGCAPPEEVEELVKGGDVMVMLWATSQNFDPVQYHHEKEGNGVYHDHLSWRFYGLPGMEQLTEVFMAGRSVQIEERFIGSPPFKEKHFCLLSFHDIATTYKKTYDRSVLMNFYVRLHSEISEEEVAYWLRSILDLFSMWGAMASFLTVLSVGLIAKMYNQWCFLKEFRADTSNATKTTKLSEYTPEISALADIRLFNSQDFDESGKFQMSAEEFHFPTTAYGEIRKIALKEHFKKRQAAEKISAWYLQQLVRRKMTLLSVHRQLMIVKRNKQRRLSNLERVVEMTKFRSSSLSTKSSQSSTSPITTMRNSFQKQTPKGIRKSKRDLLPTYEMEMYQHKSNKSSMGISAYDLRSLFSGQRFSSSNKNISTSSHIASTDTDIDTEWHNSDSLGDVI